MQSGNCEVSTWPKKKKKERNLFLLQFPGLGVGMTTASKQSSQAPTESKKKKPTETHKKQKYREVLVKEMKR